MKNDSIRAFRCHGKDVSPVLERIAAPRPDPGQVLIEIKACGLNFADLLMIRGTYQETPPAPFTLGLEVAGIVSACGAGVDLKPGSRVAVFGGAGGLAEQGVFPADRVIPLPDTMTFEDAAALQIAYGTSHVALAHRARLQKGESLLVLGATGGVGLTAVELGKLMGARVIAVARGAEKRDIALRAGAGVFIDSATQDVRSEVKALGGADVVYDPVGGDMFDAAFRACNPEARILVIGFASGTVPQPKPNHMLVKNIDLMGFYWASYLTFRPQVVTGSIATLMDWHAQGLITPHISHRLPLERAADGLELLRTRQATGKVVITI
ncbi:NADPH:quinone oxidoreductase family protein [Pseudooceanicola sediminis]|uniref:NADPH:quinone oxidoreductase family protein n=1 Tax=Pseudooceanicola sediminis TaxID=2211117 RepID=A0A399IZV7_9RHOB|nr:NADPH:quinone oxidoreductase family protein [Pseudooceanicola sediminis]KAA2313638.1 NADPH:quinone oxidoreductase family protein [Puniceibacterium sp. HSS470]RII38520.1 NADPH:quinone oxidoreductase family protein [Pseudooceanicola sediminis]|tara:strand:- start:30515 stop:31486 length:972 start_codon:yes stop_codon:yes gene_type:complete